MKQARIIGTGSYVPEKIRTNHDIEQMTDTTAEWIVARTGIHQRRIAADSQVTSDLAANAALAALDMAGVKAQEIDQIIVATITGDYPWPATACIVQNKIGATNAYAYDVSAACSGFVYGLANAYNAIRSGAASKVLVIGAEVLSRIIDWGDRNTCILFGDGAGAVVLEAQEGDCGILSNHLHSDGSYLELLYQPGYGSCNPLSAKADPGSLPYLKMQGNEVFKVAVRSLSAVAQEALDAAGLSTSDVDLFVPHQANRRILEATAKRLGFTEEQVYINVDRFGNTSAASIPIALDEANRKGVLKDGDLVLLDAFGGGFTWGATLLRW